VPSHSETGQRLAFSSFLTQPTPTSNPQTSGTRSWPKLPKRRLSPRHLFNHLAQPHTSAGSDAETTTPSPPPPAGERSASSKRKARLRSTFRRLHLAYFKSFSKPKRPEQTRKARYACPAQQQGHGQILALGSRLYKDSWTASPAWLSPPWAAHSQM